MVTIHGALHPDARHPASKIAVACIQPLAVRRLFNGLDALQFAAGWAVNCNCYGTPTGMDNNYFLLFPDPLSIITLRFLCKTDNLFVITADLISCEDIV